MSGLLEQKGKTLGMVLQDFMVFAIDNMADEKYEGRLLSNTGLNRALSLEYGWEMTSIKEATRELCKQGVISSRAVYNKAGKCTGVCYFKTANGGVSGESFLEKLASLAK